MPDSRGPIFPPQGPQAGLAASQDEQLLKQAYQYHSYSGTDMLCLMHMPRTATQDYTKMGYTAADAAEIPQTAVKAFAELQTLTVSSARNVSPVRRLGESHVHKYTRGARTIAGTLVFAMLDRDVFGEFYRQNPAEVDSGAPFFVDQIPEFHIFVSGENEYGGRVSAGLLNITLTNFGQTVSVDDIYTEVTYCVDSQTQALTDRGWKYYHEIEDDDRLLTINPRTREIEWQEHALHCFMYQGPMVHWQNSRGVDFLTTPNHRWLTTTHHDWNVHGIEADWQFRETREIDGRPCRVLVGGGTPSCFAPMPVYSDEFVELVGWVVTEGTPAYTSAGNIYAYVVAQSESANPDKVQQIRQLVRYYRDRGVSAKEYDSNRVDQTQKDFYFGRGVANALSSVLDNRSLTPSFLRSLTEGQARLLKQTMLAGDGHVTNSGTSLFIQNLGQNSEMFQMLCSMLGKSTCQRRREGIKTVTTVYKRKVISGYDLEGQTQDHTGVVWCPRTENQTWMARRNGCTFWTGNTYVAQFFLPFVEDNNVFLNKVQKVTEHSRVALSTRGFDPLYEQSLANRAGMSQDTLDEALLDHVAQVTRQEMAFKRALGAEFKISGGHA